MGRPRIPAVRCQKVTVSETLIICIQSGLRELTRLDGILSILAMLASEFSLVQPHLYDAQIPPVVYLSGVLLFVGGLAIVRAHNYWTRDWTLLVTLSGWLGLALGLFRMFAAGVYQRGSAHTSSIAFMALEGVLLVLALVMTFKAYRGDDKN